MKRKTIKNAIFLLLLIASFTISTFSTNTISSKNVLNDSASLGDAPRTAAGSGTLPNGATYSWSNETYEVSMLSEFEQVSQIMNYTGSFEENYTVSKNYFYWNESLSQNVWIEEVNTIEYRSNYTSFSNSTYSGNSTINVELDMYRVDVNYDDNLQLIWMALKNGSFHKEDWETDRKVMTNYSNEQYTNISTTQRIYNLTTGEFLWERTLPDDIDEFTYSYDGDYKYPFISHMVTDYEFSAPYFLTMQTYTTQNGDTVAWANMIEPTFYFYNDTDNNGIYSIGKQVSQTSVSNMISSDEYRGFMEMSARIEKYKWENIDKTTYAIVDEDNYDYRHPDDLDPSGMAKNITIIPPSVGSGNNISWGISYNEFPQRAEVYSGATVPIYSNWNNGATIYNSTYDNMSHGNISYVFDYNIGQEQADLGMTLELSKMSNNSFYDAVQGLSLAKANYNYFMASSEVNKTTNNVITRIEDLVNFEIQGTPIAQINSMDPSKLNYTLSNYTGKDEDLEFESIGSTVSMQVTNNDIERAVFASDMKCLLFTLENLTSHISALENFVSFYSIEATNYPVWSGEKLTHDPTFTAFYGTEAKSTLLVPDGNDDDDNSKNGASIPFGNFYLFFIVVGIIVVVIYRRRKLTIN